MADDNLAKINLLAVPISEADGSNWTIADFGEWLLTTEHIPFSQCETEETYCKLAARSPQLLADNIALQAENEKLRGIIAGIIENAQDKNGQLVMAWDWGCSPDEVVCHVCDAEARGSGRGETFVPCPTIDELKHKDDCELMAGRAVMAETQSRAR